MKPIPVIAAATLATAALFVGGWGAKEAGWRVNISGSLPNTLYRVSDSDRPAVGDYVQFCPPVVVAVLPNAVPGEPSCNGKVPLLKRVVAIAGDRVEVGDEGVRINGKLLPMSRPKTVTRSGERLPIASGEHVLKDGEIWAAGEHEDSFDSRYFGPVLLKRNGR